MKSYVHFIVACDTNFHKSIVVQHSIFLYIWQWYVTQQHTQNALLLYHCDNGYANAPQRYVFTYIAYLFCVRPLGEHEVTYEPWGINIPHHADFKFPNAYVFLAELN